MTSHGKNPCYGIGSMVKRLVAHVNKYWPNINATRSVILGEVERLLFIYLFQYQHRTWGTKHKIKHAEINIFLVCKEDAVEHLVSLIEWFRLYICELSQGHSHTIFNMSMLMNIHFWCSLLADAKFMLVNVTPNTETDAAYLAVPIEH